MGKQIRFIMDQEDEKTFFDFVNRNGVVYFSKSTEKPIIITELPNCDWFKLYLYRDDVESIKYRKTNNGVIYIDLIESPVIEYRRTQIRSCSKEISRGRLWLEMKYYDNDDVLIMKDKMIDLWYKELSKWIKKNLNYVRINNAMEYVSHSFDITILSGYKLLG